MSRKLIPGTVDYLIDTDGVVYDPVGEIRNTYINGCGYITTAVKTLEDEWVTYGVHRLNALTHLEKESEEQTEVNHRDLDITNNKLSNLEWVTPSQNVVHYEIMQKNKKYDSLYCEVNSVPVKKYNNAHDAAEDIGCDVLDIWDSVKNNTPVKGRVFYFRSRRKAMPSQLMHDRSKNFRKDTRQPPKGVKLLNVHTSEVMEFPSMLEAGNHFGVSASHIFQSIPTSNHVVLFKKQYQIQYIEKNFPILTPSELSLAMDRGSKQVLAYNFKSKVYSIFNSASEYIRYTKLSKKAVTVSLKQNRLRTMGDWVAIYLTEENKEKIQSYISSPVDL